MSRARDTADQINRVNSSAADATAITVDSSENVGIGTSSPSSYYSTDLVVTVPDEGGITLVNDTTHTSYLMFADGTSGADRYRGQLSYDHNVNEMAFATNGNERMRIDSSGNVLIGDSAPDITSKLVVSGNASADVATFMYDGGAGTYLDIDCGAANGVVELRASARSGSNPPLAFNTGGAERMRIDSSGNFMFGKTNVQDADSGFVIESSGFTNHHRDSGTVSVFDRGTNDGEILSLRRNGTVHGSIGKGGSGFFIAGVASTDFGVVFDGSGLLPSNDDGVLRDNSDNLGHPSYRWDDVYATNGTIQTSDFNEKQDIASLTATEMLVGKRISVLFKTFRWKDSVAEKGDNARTHTGVIAQDVQAAFTAEGLDAGDYALFISSTWWETQTEVPAVEAVAEVLDEDGNVTTEAVEAVDAYTRTDTYDTEEEAPEGATSKTRMGIRYPELLSFVAAYNEQRFASIEARLTALEA